MALTLATLKNHARHAVGGTLDSRLDVTLVVNDAGRHFINVHPWSWLVRPPVNLSLTASQAYVSLTSAAPDFRELIAIRARDSATATVRLTTMEDILDRRENSTDFTGIDYWVALIREGQTGVTLSPPVPRFEIWPTPAANLSNAFSIVYRATWTTLDDDADAANVPGHCEPVLIQYVRAFAQGYEDGELTERVAQIDASPAVRALKERAGIVQPNYGPITGGHLQPEYGYAGVGFNPVADM